MTNREVDTHTWVVGAESATAIGSEKAYDTYLEPGLYQGENVELVWQGKSSTEKFWDNLEGEPDQKYKNTHDVRELLRAATADKYKYLANDLSLPYQQRARAWVVTAFGEDTANNVFERTSRFLEESLELAQALGYSAEHAHALIDYVFGRPAGTPDQEAGGTMVTLSALTAGVGINLNDAAETELANNWNKMEEKRLKHLNKPINSPLPQ